MVDPWSSLVEGNKQLDRPYRKHVWNNAACVAKFYGV